MFPKIWFIKTFYIIFRFRSNLYINKKNNRFILLHLILLNIQGHSTCFWQVHMRSHFIYVVIRMFVLFLFLLRKQSKISILFCWVKPCNLIRGVFRNLSRGGLNFFIFPGGGSAPVGGWKPPEINRFHWSWGGLAPIDPPLNMPLIRRSVYNLDELEMNT